MRLLRLERVDICAQHCETIQRKRQHDLICIVLLVMLAACGTSPQQPTPTSSPDVLVSPAPATATRSAASVSRMPPPVIPPASVRVAHTLVDGPVIDVQIDGETVVSGMRYSTNTQPVEITPGEHSITITQQGSADALLSQSLNAAPLEAVILVFTGTADAPVLGVYSEPAPALSSITSSVSLIHAIPRAPDITLFNGAADLSGTVGFGVQSFESLLESGNRTFDLGSGDQPLISHALTLLPRSHYTLILYGQADNPDSLGVMTLSSRVPGRAALRLLNVSPDAGALDVYLDGALYAEDVAYARPTERRAVFAQTYQLYFFPAGAAIDTQPLFNARITIPEDAALTAVFLGPAADPVVTLVEENLSLTRPGQARMTFVNAAENAPIIRGNVGGLTDLNFAQASSSLSLPAEPVNLYWNLVENRIAGIRVAQAENLTIEAGYSYLYVVTVTSEDQPPLIFGEAVGVDETLVALPADVTPSPTPRNPTRLRLVNALDGSSTVDFVLGEAVVAAGVRYGSSSGLVTGAADFQTLSVRDPISGAVLASTDFEFQLGRTYSAYAYGFAGSRSGVLIEEEPVFQSARSSALIRVVNLTDLEGVPFGLGYLQGGVDPNATQETYATRPALFADTVRLLYDINSKTASPMTLLPPGTYDLFVIDDATSTSALRLPNITLEADSVSEIVIYQALDSLRVGGFILNYP